MEFSRQEYWSGLPFPSPGDLPDPGIKYGSPSLQAVDFTIWATWSVIQDLKKKKNVSTQDGAWGTVGAQQVVALILMFEGDSRQVTWFQLVVQPASPVDLSQVGWGQLDSPWSHLHVKCIWNTPRPLLGKGVRKGGRAKAHRIPREEAAGILNSPSPLPTPLQR